MENIAQYIEHTNLNDNATEEDIKKLCMEALQYKFYGVCIYPKFVKYAKSIVKDNCKVITVVGFPQGNDSTQEKIAETKQAVLEGANEIDMVINKDALKKLNYKLVLDDIKAVIKASDSRIVKVIIEASELGYLQRSLAVLLVIKAKANFVKTSTGKSPKGGARLSDVQQISKIIKIFRGDQQIKAAGGISDYKFAKALINAGASRIGASKSINIIEGGK